MLSFPPALSKALGKWRQYCSSLASLPICARSSAGGQSAALPEFHGTGRKEVQPQRVFTSPFPRQSVLALGNNWHCSLLWGRMYRAGFWLDPLCWAVQSLTFSPISPRLCLLVLLKQLTGAGIPITSYTQWWLQIENQTNLRIHPIPNPAEA